MRSTIETSFAKNHYDRLSPHSRWGHLKKPLHYTGELKLSVFLNRLKKHDIEFLKKLVKVIKDVAVKHNTTVTIMAVGSTANASIVRNEDSDIDLLISFENRELRSQVVDDLRTSLIRNKDFNIHVQKMKGSVSTQQSLLYVRTKMYLRSRSRVYSRTTSDFDLTFLSSMAGPVELEINFMNEHNLAYCLVDL